MTKLKTLAVLATVLVTGATASIAQTVDRSYNGPRATVGSNWNGESPYRGYNPNSPEGNRAFWDYQGRQGN